MSQFVRHIFKLLAILGVAVIISSCGGGGSGGSSGSTSNTSQDTVSVLTADLPVLSAAVDLTPFVGVSVIDQTVTASISERFFNFIDRHFGFQSALASPTDACSSNLKQLLGIKANGDHQPISLTDKASSSSGLCEAKEIGDYLLFTGKNIKKVAKTCNFILLRKSTGALTCLGESVPATYTFLEDTGFQGNVQITGNQNYVYLTIYSFKSRESATMTADFETSVKLLRIDFTNSSPTLDQIASYDSSNYQAILGFKALNNGNIVIGRMEPSTDPAALSDGKLRLVEYWTLTRAADGTLSKQVADVSYLFHANRNFNYNCFLNHSLNGDDAVLAYTDVSGTYRSTLWRIPAPTTPTSQITPVKLTVDSGSRVCWSNYPFYYANNIYSVWAQWNTGSVDIAKTVVGVDAASTSETAINIYNNGNSSGGWGSKYGKLYRAKDYLVVAAMNNNQADGLKAISIDNNGIASPLVVTDLFTSARGYGVVEISVAEASNIILVTVDDTSSSGYRRQLSCDISSIVNGGACVEIRRDRKDSDFGRMKVMRAN